MTTMTEIIPEVITYLFTQCESNPSLGAATPPVNILDGPSSSTDPLTMNPGGLTQLLWIGIGGSPADLSDQLEPAATASQGFSFLDNARTRDDQIDVICAAEAGSGDGVMVNARNGAFAVMAAVEVILRGDLRYGPGDATMGGLVHWSEVVGPIALLQRQKQNGAWALITFRVSAFVRLFS